MSPKITVCEIDIALKTLLTRFFQIKNHYSKTASCCGSLLNADVPLEMRHPFIVPHQSQITELLIKEAHMVDWLLCYHIYEPDFER